MSYEYKQRAIAFSNEIILILQRAKLLLTLAIVVSLITKELSN
jgi:hypothetical protein